MNKVIDQGTRLIVKTSLLYNIDRMRDLIESTSVSRSLDEGEFKEIQTMLKNVNFYSRLDRSEDDWCVENER